MNSPPPYLPSLAGAGTATGSEMTGIAARLGHGLRSMGMGLWLPLLMGLATIPLGLWWAERIVSYPENRAGLMAAGLGLVWWIHQLRLRSAVGERGASVGALSPGMIAGLWLGGITTGMLGLLVHPLVSCMMAGLWLAGTVSWMFRRQVVPALLLLAILAFPVVPAVQNTVGWPLRLLAAEGAGWILSVATFKAIEVRGTHILWGSHQLAVDGPCSGVRYLWTLMLVAAFRGLWPPLGWRTFAILVGGALLVGLLANMVRIALLAGALGQGVGQPGTWVHEGIGVVVLASAAAAVLAMPLPGSSGVKSDSRVAEPGPLTGFTPAKALVPVIVTAILLWLPSGFGGSNRSSAPSLSIAATGGGHPDQITPWPKTFESYPLLALPMPDHERDFYRDFPGQVGLFHAGPHQVILRRVLRDIPTLHLSESCFEAAGWKVTPLAPISTPDGRNWSVFQGEHPQDGRRLRVRQTIVDETGQSFPTVASLRWAQMLRKTQPAWWVISVAEEGQ
jgi:exosortase/archaeosortase family protein